MGALQEAKTSVSIPVIDFSKWTSSTSESERRAAANELADACHHVGFVSIVNHGVSPDLLEEAFGWSKRLFDLRTEEKMLAPHPDGPAVSQMVSSDLEVGERIRAVTDCKLNVWLPEEVLPGYRKFMVDFYWTCSQTSREILRAIGTGMGLQDPDFMLRFHSGHNNQLRLLPYPPIPAAQLESEASARMPAHTEWGSITMLLQDDCGGLENALVMNIGDLLMRWSNDWLKSTLHRVTLPPADDRFTGVERLTRARYSIPYFVSPDLDSRIECMPECATGGNPVKYEPVIQREYRLMRGKLQYPEKGLEAVAM
ncbi:putative UPF0676 protein [Amylocarpus encephaloides]|uniref:UPF0676 protein n=1 Tax=Amylocarpus encephaloides TaxID=45428 RepID=A0A9P7YS55_9HELO|nr:putative UPF0676 protein [Amylocarpus encephaloides]